MPIQKPLIDYTLQLADNVLILGHRNSEWTGHGPILEQDIALANIALDLIGQARYFYQYAARLSGEGFTEDRLAYLRDGWDFLNCLLVEQSNGDWAKTVLRQFLFSAFQYHLYEGLRRSKDPELAAISEKAWKEVNYHLRWSSEWVIRLGDGTVESHRRMEAASGELWKFTGELFTPTGYELSLAEEGIALDLMGVQLPWEEKVKDIFLEAGLSYPGAPRKVGLLVGGKEGRHTEQLGYILAEMQFLQRAYPGCEW